MKKSEKRKTVKELLEKLIKLIKRKNAEVKGLGFIIAEETFIEATVPLKPSFEENEIKRLKTLYKTPEEALLALSTSEIFHDGFHILNKNLELLGICRYVVPKIERKFLPDEFHGARYFTAKLASLNPKVIGSGIITSTGEAYYFVDGITYKLGTVWGKIYRKKEEYTYYDLLKPHEFMVEFSRLLKRKGAGKVLDLGCGIGRNLIFLAQKGFEMYGIDLSEEAIKFLNAYLKKERLKANVDVWNIFDPLPYPDNFFDAVICVQVLQHGTETQIKYALKEIKRILKPGGYFFATVAGRIAKGKVRYCLVKTARKIAPHTYIPTLGKEAGLVHFIFNKKLIKKFFKEAGLEILRIWRDEKDYYCILARNPSPVLSS